MPKAPAEEEKLKRMIRHEFASMMSGGKSDRCKARERLLALAAELNEPLAELYESTNEEHDSSEFLESIFGDLLGEKGAFFEKRGVSNGVVFEPKPLDSYLLSDLRGDSSISVLMSAKVEEKGEPPRRITTTKVCANDATELCVSLRRFAEDESGKNKKVTHRVRLDNLTIQDKSDREKTFVPTAVIAHSGSLDGGHYVAYVLEGDGKWYCYDDSKKSQLRDDERKAVISDTEESKRRVCAVKYSLLNGDGSFATSLPKAQNPIKNDLGTRCWCNAATIFLGAFSQESFSADKNLSDGEVQEKEEIIQRREAKKNKKIPRKEREPTAKTPVAKESEKRAEKPAENRTEKPAEKNEDSTRQAPPSPAPKPVKVKPVMKKHELLPSKKVAFYPDELGFGDEVRINGNDVLVKFNNRREEEELQKDDKLWSLDGTGKIVIDVAEYKNRLFKYYETDDKQLLSGALKQLISLIPQSALRTMGNSQEH